MKKNFVYLVSTVLIILSATLFFTQCITETPTREKLEDHFKNPPVQYRPMALWTWLNGYVDTIRMVYELEQMKDKGMRGALIWDVGALADPKKMIPAGPAFLGPESLKYISLALRTAKKIGLEIGICSASSWNAGGTWVGKADASKQLLSTSQIVKGPSKNKLIIRIPDDGRHETEPCSLITPVAVPFNKNKVIDYSTDKVICLDKLTSDDKFINWEVPDGIWEVISFFMCNTGQKLECPSQNSDGLVIDHL